MRFTFHEGLLYVPVLVFGPRGRAALRFVLDTGTARTMIAEGAARLLGFTPEGAIRKTRVASVLGAETGFLVRARRLHSLGWDRDAFEIACHRFAPEAQVDGLLGVDFFADLKLTVNFAAGTIELVPGRPAAESDP